MYRYKKTTWNKVRMYTHKKVWMMAHGAVPIGCVIHHINGDSKDNRLENLALMDKKAHHEMHDKDRVGNPKTLSEYYKTHDVWNKGIGGSERIKEWHKKTVATRNKNYAKKYAECLKLRTQGMSAKELALHFSVCQGQVWHMLKKAKAVLND